MKYERQQHSPLFIVLQERKRRNWPHHIHSRAEVASFFHSLKRKKRNPSQY